MEKKLLRYTIIIVIFFVGLSMGVNYQENNRSNLQQSLNSFEDEITKPNNDFVPVNPVSNQDDTYTHEEIDHNLFTGLAKDGEYVLKKGLQIILDASNSIFRFIFGSN